MVMTVAMILVMFAGPVMGVPVVMPVPVIMLMVVSKLALMTGVVCVVMGLLMRMLVLVRTHCFMKLVVDHLERYRINDRKKAGGHCSVKSGRFNRGCGNAITEQCHGLIERCGSSGNGIEACQRRQGVTGVGHGSISRAAICGSSAQ